MNAKRLLCILALVSSAFGPLRAQLREEVGIPMRDAFAEGRNVCGEFLVNRSSASLYSGFEKGGFRPGHSSSDIWRVGAEARTRRHYENTYMTGSFSFEEMNGKDMMMSMFINPGYYPIDVMEFTPGDKTLQTYRFNGGIAHSLNDAWRIGGRVAFSSQNYAKRKDIRHTNYALDFSVVPSVLYQFSKGSELGLSLVFRKTSESVEAEQVGAATADTYYAFFDKGMRYGTYQAWDGSGIHLAEAGVSRLPVKEFSYGTALQYQYEGSGLFYVFYVDAEYLRTEGLVGERGYDWYRFPGHRLAANLSLQHDPLLFYLLYNFGRLSLHADWRSQRLEEAAWDKVTDGGITLPEVYGYNTVYRRRQTNLSADYEFLFLYCALRSVKLGYSGTVWDEYASPQYPYTDRWHIWMSRLNANVVTGLPFGGFAQRFTLALGARYFWANDHERGLEAGDAAIEPASEPYRLNFEWVRRHEYLTASGMGLNGALTYRLKSVQGLSLTLDASWTHAFEITLLKGKNRWTSTLRLGYNF